MDICAAINCNSAYCERKSTWGQIYIILHLTPLASEVEKGKMETGFTFRTHEFKENDLINIH